MDKRKVLAGAVCVLSLVGGCVYYSNAQKQKDMEPPVLSADAVVVAQNFLYLDAGQDGQKFVLGRKVCDMQQVAALGVKVDVFVYGVGAVAGDERADIFDE